MFLHVPLIRCSNIHQKISIRYKGHRVLDYYWNLGIITNKRAEAYAMYQGVQLVKQRQISSLNIIGDSKNIIRIFIRNSTPKDIRLKKIVDHIRFSLKNLQVNYYHVVRKHNTTVDEMANLAIGKVQGLMRADGTESLIPPL
jgi:ribonuclease HI